MSALRILVIVSVLIGLPIVTACTDTEGPGSHAARSYFTTVLSAEWDESGHWNVSCEYSLDFDGTGPVDEKWIVKGHVRASSYDWNYLGGDTAWVDTLVSYQKARHEMSIEPRRAGGGAVAADLIAPTDTLENGGYFAGHKVILLMH